MQHRRPVQPRACWIARVRQNRRITYKRASIDNRRSSCQAWPKDGAPNGSSQVIGDREDGLTFLRLTLMENRVRPCVWYIFMCKMRVTEMHTRKLFNKTHGDFQ